MNIEELRTYCLSLPHATEHFPFDDVSLVIKVHGKMFALIPLDSLEAAVSVKCDANQALVLREKYSEAITPAFHFNKKYWNTVWLDHVPSENFIKQQVLHSYKQVIMKLPAKLRPAYTATIGFFDGVHLGHQFLLNELKNIAAQQQQASMAISFSTHPRKVLCSDFKPKLLSENAEKEALLKKYVDEVEMLEFTTDMAELRAEEFMNVVLKKQLGVKTLLLGYDHRFGSDKLTDFAQYEKIGKKLGITVLRATKFEDKQTHISSTAIRSLIEAGHIVEANRLLGYAYCLSGKVVNGYKNGRKLGFPTANILPFDVDKLVPKTGVYAVKVYVNKEEKWGMLNIGSRPTLEQPNAETSIEVHIFDFEGDIYHHTLKVAFIQRIREELRFENLDALKAQLAQDKIACKEISLQKSIEANA